MFELLQGSAPGQWVWAWTLRGAVGVEIVSTVEGIYGKAKIEGEGK